MSIDSNALNRALSLISEVDEEEVRTGWFVDLGTDLDMHIALASARGEENTVRLHEQVMRNLHYVVKDLWNIETLFDRLNWQHELWICGSLPDQMWFRYASADIDMLHVEARSLFDYLAQVMRLIADKPGQVPDKSFEKLRNWAAESPMNPQRLGADIAALLTTCEWFSDVRNIRDDVVHRGGETLVFLDKPRFCFQVYQHHRKKITVPEVMANENVVDFPLYAGVHYGYLLDYLESVSTVVYQRVGISRNAGRARHHNPGIRRGKQWILMVLEMNGLQRTSQSDRPALTSGVSDSVQTPRFQEPNADTMQQRVQPMSETKRKTEFFDTLAKVLLRCWIFGFAFLLFWFGVYMLGGDAIHRFHGGMFGLTRHELDLIFYGGMGIFKLLVFVLFLFPWLAIRLVLRKAK